MRTFTELSKLPTFLERFEYLRLDGSVGEATFGFDRYLNQRFYRSAEWKRIRQQVIARDDGRDLGVEGHDISGRLIIHHMNPMAAEDIVHGNASILDPEFLITVRHDTHNAIHYGDSSLLPADPIERRPGDTNLWSPISSLRK